jgi:hypothetical protein
MIPGVLVLAHPALAVTTVVLAAWKARDARRQGRRIIPGTAASLVAFIATQCVMPAGMDIPDGSAPHGSSDGGGDGVRGGGAAASAAGAQNSPWRGHGPAR